MRGQLPLLLGVAPFGMAFGAYAIETGLSGGMTQAMSSMIFGGASQFVAVQLIASGVPGAMIVLAVLVVNARHMLYSASLAPHVAHLDARWRWLLAYLLTDEAYAVGMQRYGRDDESPRKHWFFFGAGFALWSTWQVTTAAGIVLGAALPDSWSLDFVRDRADHGHRRRSGRRHAGPALAGRASAGEMNLWLAIGLMGAGTYAVRLSMLVFVSHERLPSAVRDALQYVMPAVLAAIILPAVLYVGDGASFDPSIGNERLLAALVAGAMAWLARNVWLTVGVGMGALWLLQWAG